jgi:CubicO group peptidase (beta-lactamase class C family)
MRAWVLRATTLWGCLTCLALLCLTGAPPTWAATDEIDPAAIDRVAAESFAATRLPGMALAVTHGEDVLLVKGYGSAGGGRPVTASTQFRLASLSKSFTALAVLQLVDAGRVDLDAPIRRYLPTFTVADAAAADRITVRDLLNQTSGLADAGFDPNDGRSTTISSRLAALRTAQPVAGPGSEFHYFDPNYQVLAALVQTIAGTPFADHLDRQVFEPLGMSSTLTAPTTQAATALAPRLARGHVLVFGQPVARDELDGFAAGSTGVVSTAEDMARWLIAQVNGGQVGSRRVLSEEGVQMMHTPPSGIDTNYAMGWTVPGPGNGPVRLEHTGVLSTSFAEQVLLPEEGYGVAVLFDGNYALADTVGVAHRIADLLTGGRPAGSFPRTLVVAVALAVLTVATLALRGRALLRRRAWATRHLRAPWWRLAPGLLWLLLPSALLVGLPALVLRTIGRAFTHEQLALSMPDVIIWLGVGAVTGMGLAAARVITLIRLRRHQPRYAEP